METKVITTERVWQDYKSSLKGFILSKVKDGNEAEDLLQEVFVKIHLHLSSLKEETRLRAWVYQVARNTVQDHFRKKKYLQDVEKVNVAEEVATPDDPGLQACILPFINKLPGKYREALILSDFIKMGQMQLAQKLQISYSGAKSRVQRARQLLHSYFTECCDITADKYGNIVSRTPKGKCLCDA